MYFGEILNIGGNKVVLVRDPRINLKTYGTPIFYVSHQSAAIVANAYLGAVKISQLNEQSTILDLSFQTENPELGKNF